MSNPTALVTGGTSGIGKATTELLHQRGYQVIVTGQNPDTITTAQRDLPQHILVLRADVRSLTDTDKVIEAIRDRFGTLDVLFLKPWAQQSRSGGSGLLARSQRSSPSSPPTPRATSPDRTSLLPEEAVCVLSLDSRERELSGWD